MPDRLLQVLSINDSFLRQSVGVKALLLLSAAAEKLLCNSLFSSPDSRYPFSVYQLPFYTPQHPNILSLMQNIFSLIHYSHCHYTKIISFSSCVNCLENFPNSVDMINIWILGEYPLLTALNFCIKLTRNPTINPKIFLPSFIKIVYISFLLRNYAPYQSCHAAITSSKSICTNKSHKILPKICNKIFHNNSTESMKYLHPQFLLTGDNFLPFSIQMQLPPLFTRNRMVSIHIRE